MHAWDDDVAVLGWKPVGDEIGDAPHAGRDHLHVGQLRIGKDPLNKRAELRWAYGVLDPAPVVDAQVALRIALDPNHRDAFGHRPRDISRPCAVACTVSCPISS